MNGTTLAKPGQLNKLAARLTSLVRESTSSAGLEVILRLKPLDLVAREAGLLDSLKWDTRIRWDGIGFRKAWGHVWTWLK